jgi:hypothetical protein
MTVVGMLGSPEVMVGTTEAFGTCRPLDPVHLALRVDDQSGSRAIPILQFPARWQDFRA